MRRTPVTWEIYSLHQGDKGEGQGALLTPVNLIRSNQYAPVGYFEVAGPSWALTCVT